MKKIITLLFFVGAFATSFAQYDHQQNNNNERNRGNDQYGQRHDDDNSYGRNVYDNRNSYPARERGYQIDQINRNFNYKIQSIQNDRYMRRREKREAIRHAENERARQIQMVNARFMGHDRDGYQKHDDDRR
ncbi:MAG TPA: hypothetical protein VIL78_18745 [Hanamia sp.]